GRTGLPGGKGAGPGGPGPLPRRPRKGEGGMSGKSVWLGGLVLTLLGLGAVHGQGPAAPLGSMGAASLPVTPGGGPGPGGPGTPGGLAFNGMDGHGPDGHGPDGGHGGHGGPEPPPAYATAPGGDGQ